LTAFDLGYMKASWINKAIIYQVTPYIFVKDAKYPDIEAKLPELADLGINTIYLQPVYKTEKGHQGYDITDYFSLREDLGTEVQLQSLISTAKSLGMRVLFDMVPNHTSIHHPFAIDKIVNGKSSPYFDYYQQSNDGALYSSNYHQLPGGFIYYFWSGLVNLNYDNEEVQRMIIDACKYWIRKFDIDGYRFDAMWGVNARAPLFGKRLQIELKSIKPDLLLLAEDKASRGAVYRQGFDAAYDWAKDTGWVSHWSWQYEFGDKDQHTIFNHPSVPRRKELLREALFSDGDSIGLRLRYLENNDLHRFISNHSPAVTKMAATLLFALPGLPMLYNGQEIGFTDFPYRSRPIFQRDKDIRSLDSGLFDFYKRLSAIREKHNALLSGTMREIPIKGAPGAVAFLRSNGSENIVVVINMDSSSANIQLQPDGLLNLHDSRISFTNIFTGDKLIAKPVGRKAVTVPVSGYTTELLLVNKK
jgi:glycosidase